MEYLFSKLMLSRYRFKVFVLLVVWFAIVFSIDSALESSFLFSATPNHLLCGRPLTEVSGGGVSVARSVRVALVVDEEWRDDVPDSAGSEARRVLLDAGRLFRGIGIHFLPIRVLNWESPDDADSVRDLLRAGKQAMPPGDADIVVLLSAQRRATSADAIADVGGRHVVVAHHPANPEQDSLVLAHEISHLFGAHHGCDVPEREGLMAKEGFNDQNLICPCTRRILEMNAQRFHQAIP